MGGRREGAGKKKGTIWESTRLKLEMRRRLVKRAHKEIDKIFDAQFALAMGVWREKEILDDEGNVVGTRVYQRPPSGEAIGYILDQVIDKAVVRVDVEGELDVNERIPAETANAIAEAIKYALPAGPTKSKTARKDTPQD